MLWYGVVQYGVVWCGTLRDGMLWGGTVWYDTTKQAYQTSYTLNWHRIIPIQKIHKIPYDSVHKNISIEDNADGMKHVLIH
jgi:hypothetical protein